MKVQINDIDRLMCYVQVPTEFADDTDLRSLVLHLERNTEEKTVMEVFKQYLKREVTIEDAKRGNRLSHINFPDRYILAIDGNQLGMIIKCYEGYKYTVQFIPGLTHFKK